MRFARHSSEDTPRAHAKDAIVQMILSRAYKVGDKLPSYRDLAEHFGIALCTLVRATHELAEEGILRSLQGKGVFVRKMPRGSGKLTTVGLVYPASQLELLRENYLTQILAGTMSLCGYHQIDLQIVAFRQWRRPNSVPVPPRDLAQRVDGLILLGVVNDRYMAECGQETIPLVLVDAQTQAAPISCIVVDNTQATNLVMNYLHDLGHRRIAYVDFRSSDDLARRGEPAQIDTSDTRERREAYLAAAGRLGLDYVRVYPPVASARPEQAAAITGTAVLAALREDKQPPTAVVCFDVWVAGCLCQTLLESGLRVPQDVSITAVASAKGSNAVGNHVITGTVIDFEEMGQRAIIALQRQTRRQSKVSPQIERVGGVLHVGTSTTTPCHR